LHGGELTVEPHKNVDFILLPTNEQQIDGTLRNRVYVQFMTLPFVTTHWVRLCVRERTLEPLTNGGCWAEGLSGGAKYVVLHDLVVCMRREKHAFINKQVSCSHLLFAAPQTFLTVL
jgi:hypothetical protein